MYQLGDNIDIQNAEGDDPVYLFFVKQKDLELASVSSSRSFA